MESHMRGDFFNDAALLIILAKIDRYKGEIEFFENKYEKDFDGVEQEAGSVKGHEEFSKEEDLEEWEFALKSLEYWKERYHIIKPNAVVS